MRAGSGNTIEFIFAANVSEWWMVRVGRCEEQIERLSSVSALCAVCVCACKHGLSNRAEILILKHDNCFTQSLWLVFMTVEAPRVARPTAASSEKQNLLALLFTVITNDGNPATLNFNGSQRKFSFYFFFYHSMFVRCFLQNENPIKICAKSIRTNPYTLSALFVQGI